MHTIVPSASISRLMLLFVLILAPLSKCQENSVGLGQTASIYAVRFVKMSAQ